MSIVQGYIPATKNEDENQIYYYLKKTALSETKTQYDGFVGYATPCSGINCEIRKTLLSLNSGEYSKKHPENEDIHPLDTTSFSCIYDSIKNNITITSPYRFEFNSTIYAENFSFPLNFEDPEEISQIDSNSYPYVRFPRTKDGVSISRICLLLFSELSVRPILYFPTTK